MPDAQPDVAIALSKETPAPIAKHVHGALLGSGCEVVFGDRLYLINLPAKKLEAHAELVGIELPLGPTASRTWSEQGYAVRDFSLDNRADFVLDGGSVNFTPAQRALVTLDYLDRKLQCDATGWNAALVASGMAEAASNPKPEWLVGPTNKWEGQPLLTALSALELLEGVSPVHGKGQAQSTGLPMAKGGTSFGAWLGKAMTGQIVSVQSIRDYWGESVAYYFGWQQYSIQTLTFPAVVGAYVWLARPADITVDDDPNVPLYSLLAVVWAILFVTTWRSKQQEYAFKWGSSTALRKEVLRPEFVGVAATDPVSGKPILVDPPAKRACRLLFSGAVTALSLLVPLAAMIASLNLQGYIVASTGPWNGIPVYVEALAEMAKPGELFDPNGENPVLPLVPVILHAITIMVLNALFKRVATMLTDMENHRLHRSHDASLLIKRFAFEACDCYLALFYIAFEMQDVPKLRNELIALFTADTIRRILLETVVPLVLNWKSVRIVANSHAAVAGAASADFATAVASEMQLDEYEDFDDYLEMVIQFGYITLFASAFPLAPVVGVIANSIELIADSIKLTFLCRRPRPVRAATIGGWSVCCYVLMLASIFTNIYIIGVASDQMAALFPSMFSIDPKQRVGGLLSKIGIGGPTSGEHEMRAGQGRYVVLYMMAMEHALLLLLLFAETFLARAPEWVRNVTARRLYEERAPRAA